ncbi:MULTISPECIES: SgcJ/EcaC family oxidoreductase [unclassified Streptomyces]|uniref:SgcJ/EcaC family oxidoreductase n=1 Tax=unclassified Streptomyces TaxID=2593676 RepID=UPI0036E24DF5
MTRRPITKRAAIVTAGALVAVGTFAAGVGVAGPDKHSAKKPTKAEIAAQFDGWNKALQTGDAQRVADRYAEDAVLLPTVSNKVRSDRAERVDYFEHFLLNKPVGKKIETHITILDNNSALDAGVYEFTLTDPDTGAKRVVQARYTYAYEKRDGEWKIVNHHSSAMPEG